MFYTVLLYYAVICLFEL